jgi:hypothetical protein
MTLVFTKVNFSALLESQLFLFLLHPTGHVGETRNDYRILVRKPRGKGHMEDRIDTDE